jgi:hypothetical protein
MEGHEAEVFLKRTQDQQRKLLDAVSARLSKEVMANYQAFIDGMRQINEIDMDISRAGVHVSNSLRKLSNAKESLVFGTLGITYRRRRRERLAEVNKQLSWLRSLHNLEDVMASACAEHRYTDAVGFIIDAQTKMRDSSSSSFAVLQSLKPKVESGLDVLRNRVDKSLDILLAKFDPAAYGAILLAYRDLDDCGVKASVAVQQTSASANRGRATTVDDADDSLRLDDAARLADDILSPGSSLLAEVGGSIAAAAAAASSGVLSIKNVGSADSNLVAIASLIQSSAMKAVKTLSKDALIDLLLKELRVKATAEAKDKAERRRMGIDDEDEADAAAADRDASPSVAAKDAASTPNKVSAEDLYQKERQNLRQRSFTDLCSSVPVEDIVAACMRIAAAITHVMHSHYMLLQWHRSPFDPRNLSNGAECEFLHRCGLDDADSSRLEDDDPVLFAQAKASATKTSKSTFPGMRPAAVADGGEFIKVLGQLRMYLLRGRNVIWQHMQQRFGSYLFAAVGAAGVSLSVERLAQCLIVAGDLMSVGLEYVGYGRSPTTGEKAEMADIDPCGALRGSLRLLCSQFMDSVHAEHFEKLKSMLSKELWQRVPVTEQAMGSIMDTANLTGRGRFNKSTSHAIAAAAAALRGVDAFSGEASTDGDSASTRRVYSDGSGLFSTWLDRGNPFGWVLLSEANKKGVAVLPTPRLLVEEDSDDEEEEDEEQLFAGAKANDKAATIRRAAVRLMRHIHGDGYALEIGLGRGPALGFTSSLGGDANAHAERDSDGDSGEEEEFIDDEAAESTSSADDDDDDDLAVRKRRAGAEGDVFNAGGSSTNPFAAAFGGQHQHVVTAAALNGFSRAVSKYLLLMEVLPSVATDAFAGLARLFELYFFSCAIFFVRPAGLKQLFDLPSPAPQTIEKERDQSHFDFLDGSTYSLAVKLSSAAAEARLADHRQQGHSKSFRRAAGSTPISPGTGNASDEEDLTTSSQSRRARAGERTEFESVELYGVSLYVRGLPALAQAQGLPGDYYSVRGAGAALGASMAGNSYSSDGVFVLLRRSLQLIGADLAAGGGRMTTGGTSALADGNFSHDTGVTARGWMPDPFITPQVALEIEGESNAFGVCERSVALESLDFMLDVMARVRHKIEAQLPPTQLQTVYSFYQRAVQCVCLLRGLMYHSLVPKLLPESGAVPNMVTSIKWYVHLCLLCTM